MKDFENTLKTYLQEISRHPILTREEEVALFKRYERHDPEAFHTPWEDVEKAAHQLDRRAQRATAGLAQSGCCHGQTGRRRL